MADIWRKKAFALGMKGKQDEVIECFDRAIYKYEDLLSLDKTINIDTDYAYALNSKGYYFITHAGTKFDDKVALECFDKAIEILPDFAYP